MGQHFGQHQRIRTPDRHAALAAGALVFTTIAGLVAAGPSTRASETIPATPPGLAAHYPPIAKEPVLLFAMHGLQEAFAGIIVDLFEDDQAGALSAFAQFQQRYHQVAALVPEWRDAYPEAPLQELGEALTRGDRERTLRAHDAVGAICHRCHVVAMVPVQQRYRWGSFATLTVTDPVAGDTGPYAPFKHRLAGAFYGVAWDLQQGQVEQARRQFQAFKARFAALSDSCYDCHGTPRRSFTDHDVQALIEDLGLALEAAQPDMTAVTRLSERIGQTSCSDCHLVHVPAAMAQSHDLGTSGGGR